MKAAAMFASGCSRSASWCLESYTFASRIQRPIQGVKRQFWGKGEREGIWRENLKAAESCAARKGDCSALELGTQQK